MKLLSKFSLVFLLSIFTFSTAIAQDAAFDKISKGLEAGNARVIAGYFDKNVELTLPGNEGVFSKAQSEQILKDFFTKNSPSGFKMMHKGGSEDGAKYGIGTLSTEGGSFRTYVFLKKSNGAYLIQQLKITEE